MTTMSFQTDDPCLNSLDVDHGEHGRAIERIMNRPEYWDRNHPLHLRALSDVRAHHEILYGTGAMASASSPTMAFNTATGEPIEHDFAPMVATGQGTPDEHKG
jgi:hypothetical protein